MPRKNILKFHLTPIKMAIMQKLKLKCWQGHRGQKGLNTLLAGIQTSKPLWNTKWSPLRITEINILHDSAIQFPGNSLKESEISKLPVPRVYSSSTHNSKAIESTQISINWWLVKETDMYIHGRIVLKHIHTHTQRIPSICNKMDGKHRLNEISQTHCFI